MLRRKAKSTTWFGRPRKNNKTGITGSSNKNNEQNDQTSPLIDNNDENEDDDNDENESTSDDQVTSEKESKFEELRNWIRSKVSYENIKTWFRWLLDYAFVEIRVCVSSLFKYKMYI